ncbi:MAG: SDR family NAD(P)-dependent oxidoreductase, partial [Gammaproteobacteria bacterium]
METGLSGRVAAITGGTAGIGLGIAAALLREGASVALMARDAARGARAVAGLAAGEQAMFVACDATVQGDVEGFIDATVGRFGRLDILVNNAGGA